MTRTSRTAALLLLMLALVAPACREASTDDPQREAVMAAVSRYLEALADAYSTLDVSVLEGVASPNEIAAVRALLARLAATGDRVESTLLTYDAEHFEVFREINVTVRLVEVWDVIRYDATTGVQKGRTPDSIQYTVLQLRRIDGNWMVVGRSVLQRETPVAEPDAEAAG